jgi:predicted alpha/beta hydrolase family esterase
MKIAEADILIVPGLGGASADHWQTNWVKKMPTAQLVEQENWTNPDPEKWSDRLHHAIMMCTRPVVLVGHSLGVHTIARTAQKLTDTKVAGAFLVTPPDIEDNKNVSKKSKRFAPIVQEPLPFPSIMIGSSNDPFCDVEAAAQMAAAWGANFNNAGEIGHVNPKAGFGPWPEGLMAFANLMRRI